MSDRRSENSLGGRVRRYAQVSTTVGGIAARYAGKRAFGLEIDGSKQASELTAALGGLKGPLMKVAQMLSSIPEALPGDYAAELAQLQSEAPPMGKPFVRRRMAAELGADWQQNFQKFDLDAANAASLGQVHRATLHDGREVACKVQYPGIESAVEADLSQLRLIFEIYKRYDRAIDTSEIYKEISERLREELDYAREAKNARLYGRILAGEPHVHVPEVVDELSSGRLITLEWVTGNKLLSFKDAPLEARQQIARNMFRAWYVPFYDYGVIHGDPHLGNYTVREDHDVNLLDFGCIRIFPPRFVGGVIDLFWALVNDDKDLAVHAYEAWGFENLSKDAIDILNTWAAFLYAPLMEDRARPINETNDGRAGQRVVSDVHKKLKEYGGVTPPREFVLMDRAAIGLGSVFLHLKAELNWHRMFLELTQDYDVARIERQQSAALAAVGLTPAA
ncbi:MAG: AarF/ABC1/UbiB kinase family protein [Pseudomonadota bacterium]